jgi:hypothetical protein
MLAFVWREDSYGRFTPVPTEAVDGAWIAANVLKYPAEVVGAAWDEDIGTPEVVALVARMVGEGKLESSVSATGGPSGSMTLGLKVDRSTLTGYERTLVDALFLRCLARRAGGFRSVRRATTRPPTLRLPERRRPLSFALRA